MEGLRVGLCVHVELCIAKSTKGTERAGRYFLLGNNSASKHAGKKRKKKERKDCDYIKGIHAVRYTFITLLRLQPEKYFAVKINTNKRETVMGKLRQDEETASRSLYLLFLIVVYISRLLLPLN